MNTAFIIALFTAFVSCKKLVDIGPPVNTITTAQVFADSTDANSAILGIYTMIREGGSNFMNGLETIYLGESADELLPFQSQGDQFSPNILNKSNPTVQTLWVEYYSLLYQANASIEGLQASGGISPTAKSHLIGEAKFIRALIYFYLTNLFGNVPYIKSSNYTINALAANTPQPQIYDSIVSDLTYAQANLSNDYSYSNGEKVRANSLTATALLARVYLYMGDWNDADNMSTQIIGNNNFALDSLNQIFLANSSEAILQWSLNANYGSYNATQLAVILIPYSSTNPPPYYMTSQLLNDFEPGDNRKIAWTDSTVYNGITYYYPYKYKIGSEQQDAGVVPTEYYTVLRLAEQYLIRAEAEANGAGSGVAAAISDLNIIRLRAGLPGYSGATDQTSVLNAIMHERRIELFTEWGHRWLDLKRTGTAHNVLSIIPYKMPWQGDYQLLYPIPYSDILTDPNLTQNPGYNQ